MPYVVSLEPWQMRRFSTLCSECHRKIIFCPFLLSQQLFPPFRGPAPPQHTQIKLLQVTGMAVADGIGMRALLELNPQFVPWVLPWGPCALRTLGTRQWGRPFLAHRNPEVGGLQIPPKNKGRVCNVVWQHPCNVYKWRGYSTHLKDSVESKFFYFYIYFAYP